MLQANASTVIKLLQKDLTFLAWIARNYKIFTQSQHTAVRGDKRISEFPEKGLRSKNGKILERYWKDIGKMEINHLFLYQREINHLFLYQKEKMELLRKEIS